MSLRLAKVIDYVCFGGIPHLHTCGRLFHLLPSETPMRLLPFCRVRRVTFLSQTNTEHSFCVRTFIYQGDFTMHKREIPNITLFATSHLHRNNNRSKCMSHYTYLTKCAFLTATGGACTFHAASLQSSTSHRTAFPRLQQLKQAS